MHITNEDGLMYITLREGKVAVTKEPKPDIFVDLDAEGEVLGIEIIGSQKTTAAELMDVFQQFHLDEKLVMGASAA